MPVVSKLAQVTLPRAVVAASLRNVYGDRSKVTPDLVDLYFAMTVREGNRRALGQRFAQVVPGAMAERIPEIEQPTLILWGGRDRLIPPDNAERFRREWLHRLAEGRLTPVVDSVFSLEEAAKAHSRMEANENVGKIVLRVTR